MDSVVGAILMAWYYGELKPLKSGVMYSPVINIPRDQLHLRIEIVRHLEQCGLLYSLEHIFFAGEVPLETVSSVGLIDFNRLNKEIEPLADRIDMILDHHLDEKLYSPVEREIKPMGSATTLIVFKILKASLREITCVTPNDAKFHSDIIYSDLC